MLIIAEEKYNFNPFNTSKRKFNPAGAWLLGAGGAGDGFLLFMDVAGKKFLREEKAPMHIHALAMNETRDTIYAVGHHRIAVFEMKG